LAALDGPQGKREAVKTISGRDWRRHSKISPKSSHLADVKCSEFIENSSWSAYMPAA
jgi:hypothetical protein